MNIGELFISLGIKGSDKTIGALTETRKGMDGLASTSLEAKAALVGAMYALERLFSASGKTGTDLTNFNALMGGGMVQTLQRYQYAARQVGVSNQEVEGSFKSLTATATKALLGEGVPKGTARISQVIGAQVGEMEKLFKDASQGHPERLLQKLQDYAQHEGNVGLRNENLHGFGMSDAMIAAMSRGAFNQKALGAAPTYGDNEISQLDKANVAWSNLGNTIEMAVGHFNAKHGGELVADIAGLVPKVIKVAEAFEKLAEKVKLFDKIGLAFKGWEMIFNLIADHVKDLYPGIEAMSKLIDDLEEKALDRDPDAEKAERKTEGDAAITRMKGGEDDSSPLQFLSDAVKYMRSVKVSESGDGFDKKAAAGKMGPRALPPHAIAPQMPATPPAAAPTSQSVSVNQTLNFNHDGADPQKAADIHRKTMRDAARQLPSISGGQ